MSPLNQPREAGRAALRRLDWRAAALHFTAAADGIEADPHGNVTGDERCLRRDAYLALCRTSEFRHYREVARKRQPQSDFRSEWLEPDGALVLRLLVPIRVSRASALEGAAS
jgi:hypothetical protein